MRNLTVAAVMTKDPITVDPDTGFKDIVDLLSSKGISAVPVVDGHGAPVGVVSEADLLCKEENVGNTSARSLLAGHRTKEHWRKAVAARARDLMTAPVRVVGAAEPVRAAARDLARSGLRRFFVLDQGKLVGVLSRRDLLKVFTRDDDVIRDEIEREVFQRVIWADPSTFSVTVDNGSVLLLGQLERKSEVDTASRLTPLIPGVVEVRNRMDYAWNDEPDRRRH